jgi:hypothetical protein
MKGEETLGEKNDVTRNYIKQNRIFADAFNFFMYGGRQVIDPESLKPMDTQENIILRGNQTGKRQTKQRTRDLVKLVSVMTNNQGAYMILAVENQSDIHYSMPVRAILYDAMQYTQQVEEVVAGYNQSGNKHGLAADEYLSRFRKGDTILPVVTLVIYFGVKEWDGPLSLHDMFPTKDNDLLAFVPDYKLNLLAPCFIKDKDYKLFKSSLREVMLFIKYSKDKKKAQELLEKDEAFRHVDKDAVEVINVCTGAKLPVREEEGVVDMCQAIKELMEDAAAEAKEEAARAKAEASSAKAEASSAKAEASSAKAEAAKATEEKISVLLKSVKAVMEKTGMTLEQTFSVLDLSGNDREKLMTLL